MTRRLWDWCCTAVALLGGVLLLVSGPVLVMIASHR
jgi:hypothetical protein